MGLEQDTQLQVRQDMERSLQPQPVEMLQARMGAIKWCKTQMVEEVHYGLIPGTKGGKSLWLPGAELVRMALTIPVSELDPPVIEIDEKRKFIKATSHLGVVAGGMIHADVRRSANSDESRFKNFPWAELQDFVPQRAWKRAFVQIINVMSGLSGEFQEAPIGAEESEAKAVPEEKEEPTTPRERILKRCPEHDVEWIVGEWGRFHNKPKCSLASLVRPIAEEAFIASGEPDTFNDWIKLHFAGSTWSKLTDEECLDALAELRALVTKPTEEGIGFTPGL